MAESFAFVFHELSLFSLLFGIETVKILERDFLRDVRIVLGKKID